VGLENHKSGRCFACSESSVSLSYRKEKVSKILYLTFREKARKMKETSAKGPHLVGGVLIADEMGL
jgi:hypothetical protein